MNLPYKINRIYDSILDISYAGDYTDNGVDIHYVVNGEDRFQYCPDILLKHSLIKIINQLIK